MSRGSLLFVHSVGFHQMQNDAYPPFQCLCPKENTCFAVPPSLLPNSRSFYQYFHHLQSCAFARMLHSVQPGFFHLGAAEDTRRVGPGKPAGARPRQTTWGPVRVDCIIPKRWKTTDAFSGWCPERNVVVISLVLKECSMHFCPNKSD